MNEKEKNKDGESIQQGMEAGEAEQSHEVDRKSSTPEAAIPGMQKILEFMERSYAEMQEMKEKTSAQSKIIEMLHQKIGEVQQELSRAKDELKQAREELTETRTALEAITKSPVWSSPQPSYAEVARTPPESHPSNVMTLSSIHTTSSNSGNAIYCTIDVPGTENSANEKVTAKTVRTILEAEMRARPCNDAWRCRAVTEDRSNPQRLRIVCRNENEQDVIERTIEEKLPTARILNDSHHQIRADGVPRAAIVDEEGKELPGIAEWGKRY